MWKCNKCKEKIIGVYAGYTELNDMGKIIEGSKYAEKLSHYRCTGCDEIIGQHWIELYDKAKWEED